MEKLFDFPLTLHRKLVLSFSLSAALIITVGTISYFYSSMVTVLIVTAMAVAVTMITGLLIYRSITFPIDSIKETVEAIAKKNFDVEIKENARCDELGELARSISKMKDHLKEKDRLKDEFINVASHELRTPIQPIVAYVDLARKGVVNQEKAFEVISNEAKRLKRLADDILDVSRIEGKRLSLNKETFSIDELLIKLVEENRTSLNRGVSMSFKSDIKTSKVHANDIIYGDKYRIMQVMANIITNSIKFTKSGSIEVASRPLDSGSAIEVIVSDTGGGIPDEIFPKLFEKFATKGVGQGTQNGTGLGLFISKAIIEAHGGTIAGLNNNKGGATFRVILPVEGIPGDQATGKVGQPREKQNSPNNSLSNKALSSQAPELTVKATQPIEKMPANSG